MSIITAAIKAAGITCKTFEPENGQDGFAMMLDGRPIILVNKNLPLERQRFTAAYFLGLILLGYLDDESMLMRAEVHVMATNFAINMVSCVYVVEHVEAGEVTADGEDTYFLRAGG